MLFEKVLVYEMSYKVHQVTFAFNLQAQNFIFGWGDGGWGDGNKHKKHPPYKPLDAVLMGFHCTTKSGKNVLNDRKITYTRVVACMMKHDETPSLYHNTRTSHK